MLFYFYLLFENETKVSPAKIYYFSTNQGYDWHRCTSKTEKEQSYMSSTEICHFSWQPDRTFLFYTFLYIASSSDDFRTLTEQSRGQRLVAIKLKYIRFMYEERKWFLSTKYGIMSFGKIYQSMVTVILYT